jgi:hypothetical protein
LALSHAAKAERKKMNTAFIGLDYIFDIVHPDGTLAKAGGYALGDAHIGRVNQAHEYPCRSNDLLRQDHADKEEIDEPDSAQLDHTARDAKQAVRARVET